MSNEDKIFTTLSMTVLLVIFYAISTKYFEYDIKRMEIHCSYSKNETHTK